MSTTFEVYPGTSYIPSFREILELAAQRLASYLDDYAIAQRPVLSVSLHSRNPDKLQPTQLDQPAVWHENWYAWFQALPNKGGTDAHFRTIDPFAKEIWETFIEEMGQEHPLQSHVAHCISYGYYWFFRRSAGQSATINVAYGMLAAAVAELTDGFIFSDDSAWDYSRFPASAADFYTWYFRPEHAIDPECRDWATRCLARIPSELL